MSQHIESHPTQQPPALTSRHRALVLVIDPNETTRSVLEVALNRDGFDVWSSSTGEKALELLRPGRIPDVVVLEADLGEEDGFSLVAQLRGELNTANVPVLLLASAQTPPNIQALADVVGIDQYILKPAYARDVVALVRLEHARRSGSKDLRFHATQLPPAQLLRALLSCPRSGRLSLANGLGEVTFRNGRLIDVRFEGRGDLDALVRALALTRDAYSLTLEQIDGFAEVQVGVKELVLHVLPRLARWEAVQSRSLPLDSKLVVDFGRLAPALKTMPDGINQVTQLFDGFRTLQAVLIDSPYNETLTLEVATRLYLMGVIVPASGEALVTDGKLAPKLFEPKEAEADVLMHELFADGSEIRSDVPFPSVDGGDWFEEPHGTGLELTDPAGGWTMLPAPEILSGLPESMQQQLSAFNIQVEIEPPSPTPNPEAHALRAFVRGEERAPEPAAESPTVSASVEQAVEHLVTSAPAPVESAQLDEDKTPPLGAPIITAPAVEVPAPVAVSDPAPVAAVAAPSEAAQVAAPFEAEFFGESSEPVAAATHPAIISKKRRSRSLLPWVLFSLGVVALAALIEAMRAEKPAPVVEAPAVPAVVAPAAAIAPAPEPVTEESAPEEQPVDINDNLVEARRYYEGGQYSKALSVLDQVLSDAPRSADAWLLSALVHYDASDAAAAKNAIARVLELDPKNARVQLLIASIAFDENDKERAHLALNRYLELEPNGQHAKEAQALLKR